MRTSLCITGKLQKTIILNNSGKAMIALWNTTYYNAQHADISLPKVEWITSLFLYKVQEVKECVKQMQLARKVDCLF